MKNRTKRRKKKELSGKENRKNYIKKKKNIIRKKFVRKSKNINKK